MTSLTLKSILFTLLLGSFSLRANPIEPGENDTLKPVQPLDLGEINLEDDPFLAYLDSIMYLSLFSNDSALVATKEFDPTDIEDTDLSAVPDFHDSIYTKRLGALDAQSPMDLQYNHIVKGYINLYSKRRREQVSRMLGLAEYYFPMFEEALDKYDLPLELKYLAVVESALNPAARSRVGATGLWQFMYSTGKLNGLKVSSYVDERSDPIKSTEAACKYLQTLYGIFGDWGLALAAYNSGPGNVSKAIRRSGGSNTYWGIRPYLPRETRGYVPAFIAVNYIMNHAADHYIYPTEIKPSYFQMDTVVIKEQISFEQISKLIDITEDELAFMNPGYRHKIIPKVSKDYCRLVLPSSKVGLFITHEDSIYHLAQKDFEVKKPKLPQYVEMNDKIRHRVRRGEVLGTIARKYGVSVRSIKRWNGLRSNTIRIGQRLTIYPRKLNGVNVASSKPKKKSKPQAEVSPKGDYITYKVQNGETFYSIARKYPGVSAENIMGWNNIRNAKRLKPGMKLKIYPNS